MMKIDGPWLQAVDEFEESAKILRKKKEIEEKEKEQQRKLNSAMFKLKNNLDLKDKNQIELRKISKSVQISTQPDPVKEPATFNIHYTQKQNVAEPRRIMGFLFVISGAFTIITIFYLVYQFLHSFNFDLFHKINEKSTEMEAEVRECARQYLLNKCDTIVGMVPHMGPICLSWTQCMQQNPASVDRYQILT